MMSTQEREGPRQAIVAEQTRAGRKQHPCPGVCPWQTRPSPSSCSLSALLQGILSHLLESAPDMKPLAVFGQSFIQHKMKGGKSKTKQNHKHQQTCLLNHGERVRMGSICISLELIPYNIESTWGTKVSSASYQPGDGGRVMSSLHPCFPQCHLPHSSCLKV